MYWIPWISFATWDYAATNWFGWKRLNRYDIDGHHKRSIIILGKLRRPRKSGHVSSPSKDQ